MDRKFEIAKEKIKIGDILYYAEDNSTYRFDSFRVVDFKLEFIYEDSKTGNIALYLKQPTSTKDEYTIPDFGECYGQTLFKTKKDATAKVTQMRKDATSAYGAKSKKKDSEKKKSESEGGKKDA